MRFIFINKNWTPHLLNFDFDKILLSTDFYKNFTKITDFICLIKNKCMK
jgi:hypothetical protein